MWVTTLSCGLQGRAMSDSALEAILAQDIESAGLPDPEREYQFCPGRKWRFDFAWIGPKVAAEVEGGHWVGGRHVRPAGFASDCRKYSQAALLHWRVLRFVAEDIESGAALAMIARALGSGN